MGLYDGALTTIADISEVLRSQETVRRHQRSMQALGACNRVVAMAVTEEGLLGDICAVLAEIGGARVAWIAFRVHDERKALRVAASAGPDAAYLDEVALGWGDDPMGRGPDGEAIRTGRPSIIGDALTDPRLDPWKDDLIGYGLRSFLVIPLRVHDETSAVLGLGSDEPNAYAPTTVEPFLDMATTLAFGIEALRRRMAEQATTEALRASEARFRQMIRQAPIAMMLYRGSTILMANDASTRMFHAPDVDAFVGAPLMGGLAPSSIGHVMDRIARRARGESVSPDFEVKGRRGDGTVFPMRLVTAPVELADGPAMLACISDLSEQAATEERLLAYQERLRALTSDLAVAEERERRRIAEDLHDRVGHALALARNLLDPVRTSSPAIERVASLIDGTIADTRTLLFDLSPPMLHQLGLVPALTWLAETVGRNAGFYADVTLIGPPPELAESSRILLFRAAQELLHNVQKHASAQSVRVVCSNAEGVFSVDVEDDGIGFPTTKTLEDPLSLGFGLLSIRERLAYLGGDITIEPARGRGTRVRMVVPVGESGGDKP